MPDREKVMKGLEHCLDYYDPQCEKCPYQATEEEKKHVDWDCHKDDLQRDALELLKEQEPAQVIQREAMHMLFLCCGSCGVAITDGDKFCRMCGRKVKWDV